MTVKEMGPPGVHLAAFSFINRRLSYHCYIFS